AGALPARNETDKRFVFRGSDLRSRQTRNDWKLPPMKKWRSQRSCSARLFSRSVQSPTEGESQTFSFGGSLNGATVLAAIPSGALGLSIALGWVGLVQMWVFNPRRQQHRCE